ncbi:hypothetical protein GCM10023193_39860 [Planotetraspora kaengkrachanensis]|uniref:Uncharacterized protein n=1 Tax=Planotetraspora kaengkrachanensis TaxID=575193 RepID=A0A8J3PT14_9ACTN|nr:hypothetical protein Pka01_33060 [Planotetraspora kaengkrachanensis]
MRAEGGESLLAEGQETQGGAFGAVSEDPEMPHRYFSPFLKPVPIGLLLAQILVDAGTPAFVGPRESP